MDIDNSIKQIVKNIDSLAAPMSIEDYREFLTGLIDEINTKRELAANDPD